MALELISLRKAIESFDRSLQATEFSADFPSFAPVVQETLRSGVIQNFEVAYEQAWKMMKRWIETNVGAEAADGVTRRELFRLAAEQKLIDDVDEWMTFHRTRNTTSHTYDLETANDAYTDAVAFLPLVKVLLARLEARND
jgi:nucleotidyltransferase substrate binding protein (TIGR01987 family)